MNFQQLSDAQLIGIMNNPTAVTLLAILAVWALIWKGIALWKAARNSHKAWYIALLVVNTVGLLEIVYIFFFSKKGKQN